MTAWLRGTSSFSQDPEPSIWHDVFAVQLAIDCRGAPKKGLSSRAATPIALTRPGPWNKTLTNTIIVIGNEADPITPLIGAKKLADALGDSAVLIEQDDYGHSSLAMHSNCTAAALQNYFAHNKLPTQDIFCGTNQVLFPAPGGDVTKKTANRAKTASKVEASRCS
ncbi:hypothetical protein RSOLAG1IB_11349 [Rhizoctonia solani AG-1 IB]|uniref:Peptidase S33 tripeptidyl aminopeptidase-like C-terminal domain-containing protein n=1 Tax=Thanatephorus cucumeris (strain AG1-IB / isolate 7/3/14) TaxID=1108050 RepID=A0A0B7FB01_THACB|nr:hypothetical protein RSOLAG1IB_11349 [Rhizoctonia solani AG-1 IB]